VLQYIDQIRSVSCALKWGAGSACSNLSPMSVKIFPKVVAVVLLLSTALPARVCRETVLYFDSKERLAYCAAECTICCLVLDAYIDAGSVNALPSESVHSC
jgi:hypothetical protein